MILAMFAEVVTTVTVQGPPPTVSGSDLLAALIIAAIGVVGALGSLAVVAIRWLRWKLEQKIADTDTTQVTKEVVSEVKKATKLLNGTSKPEDNPRGLTGLIEELSVKTGDLADKFATHEELDRRRHDDNKAIAQEHKVALEELRRDISGPTDHEKSGR